MSLGGSLDGSAEIPVVEPSFHFLCLYFNIRAARFFSLLGHSQLHQALLKLWREYCAPALTA
jgi:hypothetical protein